MERRKITVEELLKRYAVGERNFTEIEIVQVSPFMQID